MIPKLTELDKIVATRLVPVIADIIHAQAREHNIMLFIDISTNNSIAHKSEGSVQETTKNVTEYAIQHMIEATVDKHLPEVLEFQPDPVKARKLARKWAVLSLLEWVAYFNGFEIAIVDESQQVIVDG